MKKAHILVAISCLFAASCTHNPSIIKIKRNSINRTEQPISINYNKQNNFHNKANISVHSANKKQKFRKNNVFERVPVIYPSFNNSYYYSNNIKKSVKIEKSNGKIKISVENMPLNEFINLVFGKTLKVSYFLDNRIRKKKDLITLKMEHAVSYDKFMGMVYAILSRYNILAQNKDGTIFIVPGKFVQQAKISEFVVGRNIPQSIPDNKIITAIIPFYYIKASIYKGLIKKLALTPTAPIGGVANTNALIITDKASNIKGAIKIINLFDRLTFEHKNVVLMSLNYLDPATFIKKLKEILPFEGIPISRGLGHPGIILIPMPAISSILIITPKMEWVKVVYFWKNKLDTVSALGNQPRFFVYYPQNRRASDLASVFSQLGSNAFVQNKKKGAKSNTSTAENNIKVVVDKGRNALVIFAPPKEYLQIKSVLDKLDTLPKEVLVQVTIAEITLTNKLQYGIEWYLKHSGKYSGTLQTVGGLGLGSSGINYSLITDTAKFQALLNAYAHKNLINVISSPRLVVLDNHNATINVGTQVPTVTSETNSDNVQSQGTTSLLRTIEYRNTGVILHIKPTINSGGILTMTIQQEVSEPQVNDTSKIDSPLILNRSISTSVVLRSGTTLLLGGLIKRNNSSTINKVPLLGDIPIIGNLFKTTSKGTTKTELIIEITPYIISNIGEAKMRTKQFESLMKWFKKESSYNYMEEE